MALGRIVGCPVANGQFGEKFSFVLNGRPIAIRFVLTLSVIESEACSRTFPIGSPGATPASAIKFLRIREVQLQFLLYLT